MENSNEMYNFSSKLWFNPRAVNMATGEASVYLQVVLNGKHGEFSLKFKWPSKKIDLVNSVLLARFKDDKQAADHNLFIMRERARHNEIVFDYRYKRQYIDIPIFRRELSVFDSRESFSAYMEREIVARFNKKEIDLKTKQNAMAAYHLLIQYDKTALFNNINLKWMKALKQYLQNTEYKPGKKYTPGTIWTRIKEVKTYLILANKEPTLRVHTEVLEFPNPKPPTETTYCNEDEVRRLMIVNRSGELTITQKQVLSAFLFACFTGLRISDVYRVNYSWIITPGYLDFIPKKNLKKGKKLHIAIMPMAQLFIQKMAGNYFELPTEAEYNRSLKEIAIKAEINKRLTSHVGRHTYGYLYMTKVGNIYGLQKALGHSKLETTERYAHLDDEYQTASAKTIQGDFEDLLPGKFEF
jgi:integrase/recombinase XerD